MKRWLALLMAACLVLPASALAGRWDGVTVYTNSTFVEAPSTGILEALDVRVGQAVQSGEALGMIRANRVYATQDGSVARVATQAGQRADNTVLELAPVSPYLVYCTSEKSYIYPENKLIHAGETVYLRCADNGTHRAIGFVHHVSGNEYQLELTAGEMYIGETAWVYRAPDLDSKTCVGLGTVVSSDPETYTASGLVTQLRVQEGDRVERGQLLYTWTDGDSLTVTAPASGLVTAIRVNQGSSAQKNGIVAEMAAYEDILLEIHVSQSQMKTLSMGQSVRYTRGADTMETVFTGRICFMADVPEDGLYTVRIQPDEPETLLGMTVDVLID